MFQFLYTAYKIVDASTENGPVAGIHRGPDNSVRFLVHIKISSDAAGQIFHNGEAGAPIDIFRCQQGFQRKHLIIEPALKRKIVSVGAQKGHAGMGMCIFKAWHNNIAICINFPIPVCRRSESGISHISDLVITDMDLAMYDRKL